MVCFSLLIAARGWRRGGGVGRGPQANPDTAATKANGCRDFAHAPTLYALMIGLFQKQTLLTLQIARSVIFQLLVL